MNGTHWAVVRTPKLEGRLLDVAVRTRNDVWAVGYFGWTWGSDNNRPLILHWDGTRWQNIRAAPARAGSSLNSIAVFSAGDVWASGVSDVFTRNERRFVVHWDGVRWRLIPKLSVGARRPTALNDDTPVLNRRLLLTERQRANLDVFGVEGDHDLRNCTVIRSAG